jgi:hypothetical protein
VLHAYAHVAVDLSVLAIIFTTGLDSKCLKDVIIWSRHCLDTSTAFLSGQCVYI